MMMMMMMVMMMMMMVMMMMVVMMMMLLIWLVVLTILKNMKVNGKDYEGLFPIYINIWETKKCSKPPTRCWYQMNCSIL